MTTKDDELADFPTLTERYQRELLAHCYVLQMLIEVLPKIATEVAKPISAIDQLTVISTDGAGALPRQVTDNVTQTLSMLKTTTGLDLESLIKKSVDQAASGSGLVVAAAEPAGAPGSSE